RLFSALAKLEDQDFKDTILQALDNETSITDIDFIQERVSFLYPQLQAKIQTELRQPAIEPRDTAKRKLQIGWKITAAAAVILAFMFGGLYFISEQPDPGASTA